MGFQINVLFEKVLYLVDYFYYLIFMKFLKSFKKNYCIFKILKLIKLKIKKWYLKNDNSINKYIF